MSNDVQARLEREVSEWWHTLTTLDSEMTGDEGLADFEKVASFLAEHVLSIEGEFDTTEDGVQIKNYVLVLGLGGPTITAKSYAGAWASLEIVGEWQGCERVSQHAWLPCFGQFLGEMITSLPK